MFADHDLAARLEGLAAEELVGFVSAARRVDPECGAATLDIAGGVAVYLGDGSPINQAVGMGFSGAMGADEALELECFFGLRGQRPLAVLSPLAHSSVAAALGARGWVVDGFENTLVRELAEGETFESPEGVEVRECVDDEERSLWAQIAAIAFSSPLEPLPEQLALSAVAASRAESRLFLAFMDGRPAACGELTVADGVGWLSADGTLPHFRRRGAQQALQAARLTVSAQCGCEIAVSEALPGSASQRNMERAGFRVAYTRIDLAGPRREGAE